MSNREMWKQGMWDEEEEEIFCMVFSIPRGTAILLPFFLSCKRKPSCKSTREGFKMRLACD